MIILNPAFSTQILNLLLILLLLRGGILPAGPAFVYGCYWSAVPAYVMAELLGGIAAALVSWPLYGTGLQLGRCAGLQSRGMLQQATHLLGGRAGRLPAASASCPHRPRTCLSALHHVGF